jgi:hypothetical protein
MAEKKKILAWLFCYGHWDPVYKSPVETIGHDQYLRAFVESLVPIKDRIDYIYLSGGVTDAQGKTECKTVKPEVDARLNQLGLKLPILEDIGSLINITTVKTFAKTLKETYQHHSPLLYCSRSRYELNYYLVSYFGKQFNLSLNPIEIVAPLSIIDTRPDSAPKYQSDLIERIKKEGMDKIEAEEIGKKRQGFF